MRLSRIGTVVLTSVSLEDGDGDVTLRFEVKCDRTGGNISEGWIFGRKITHAGVGNNDSRVVVRRFSKVDDPDFMDRYNEIAASDAGIFDPKSTFLPECFLWAAQKVVDTTDVDLLSVIVVTCVGGSHQLLIEADQTEDIRDIVGYARAFVRRLNRYMADYNKANPSS